MDLLVAHLEHRHVRVVRRVRGDVVRHGGQLAQRERGLLLRRLIRSRAVYREAEPQRGTQPEHGLGCGDVLGLVEPVAEVALAVADFVVL